MTHKRKAESFPDWLDVGKYKILRTPTALEWYTQIVIRREFWDFAHRYSPALEEGDEQLPLMPQGGAA